VPDESALTEKERIRRAEQRLLPSQPPPEPPAAGPSANPHLHNGENIYDADDGDDDHNLAATPVPSRSPQEVPSAPTLEDLAGGGGGPAGTPPHLQTEDKQELERRRLLAEASAPPEFPEDYDGHAAGAAGGGGASSSSLADHQATAPPPEAVLGFFPAAGSAAEFAPSAPALDEVRRGQDGEEAAYGPHFAYGGVGAESSSSCSAAAGRLAGGAGAAAVGQEPLPRYER
jgi:hypothetical protein